MNNLLNYIKKIFNNKKTSLSKQKNNFFLESISYDFSNINKESKINKINSDLNKIIKSFKSNDDIINYLKKHNIKVYKVPFAQKVLNLINENQGFILENSGFCGLFINLITDYKFSFNSKRMFIIDKNNYDFYDFLHQFYLWYSCDTFLNKQTAANKSKKNFNKIYNSLDDNSINSLSYEEILELKDLIFQDIEAIKFVVQASEKIDGAKNSLKKLSLGGASI